MTFTISAQDLLRAARRAALACRASKLPFTSALHLSAEDGLLTIVADTLELRLATAAWGEGGLPPVIVRAASLLAFLAPAARDGGPVTLAPAGGEGDLPDLRLRLGESEALLRGVVLPQDFPGPRATRLSKRDLAPAATLEAMIRTPLPAVSREETRYYLGGVFFDVEDGRLRTIATDGHRMLICEPDGRPFWNLPPFILPRDAAQLLLRDGLLSATDDGLIEVEASDNGMLVTFTGAAWSLAAKTIDGTYPNYRQVAADVPAADAPAVAVKDPKKLTAALRQVMAGRGKEVAGVVLANGSGNALHLKARLEDGTRTALADGAEWTREGEHPEVGFNPRYLADVAQAMPEGFTLRLGKRFVTKFQGEPDRDWFGPALAEAAGTRCILMPMRV